MSSLTRRLLLIAAASLAGAAGLGISEKFSLSDPAGLVTSADARIGRPATPMSYAGAARRTARRGAAAAGAAYYGSGCYQAVDEYGRVYTQCP